MNRSEIVARFIEAEIASPARRGGGAAAARGEGGLEAVQKSPDLFVKVLGKSGVVLWLKFCCLVVFFVCSLVLVVVACSALLFPVIHPLLLRARSRLVECSNGESVPSFWC